MLGWTGLFVVLKHRIARYKALSARRRRPDAELDEKIASSMADPADDPEVVLQKKTRAELLRHSLARLSPEHGEVIDLVYFHGKSVKEVAEIVGIAEATVKTRMFGEDAHVLRTQEVDGVRCSGLDSAATSIALENVAGRV
jgi:RNA polymerase sigma factor (sigma-70 family)